MTTNYPGASAEVVEATVAQPIEAQVVGVDKMIYMKSVSGDDGSYTLTGSFELGTDPDINTVNVNNRVQIALVQAARGRPAAGRHGQEEILGAARRDRRLFAEAHPRPAVHLQLRHDQPARPDQEHAGRRRRDAVGPQDYAMRAWVQTDRLTGLNLTTGDIINAIQSQNVQAAVGRIGARPISDDQQLQLNIQTKGRLTSVERVREHRHPHQPGRLGAAARRRRAARARRRQSRPRDAAQRRPGRGHRDLPVARRQRDHDPQRPCARDR